MLLSFMVPLAVKITFVQYLFADRSRPSSYIEQIQLGLMVKIADLYDQLASYEIQPDPAMSLYWFYAC